MCPGINHFTDVLFRAKMKKQWLDHVSVYKTFGNKFKGKQENKNMANIPWTCGYVKPVKL